MNATFLKTLILVPAAAMLFQTPAFCQKASGEKWTLGECIDYAREKNLDVQSARIQLETSEVNVKQASAARMPSLGASISQGLSHSRQDGMSGDTKNNLVYTGNYQLSAGMTLWNGGKLNNTLKQQKISNQAQAFDVDRAQNSIEIAVTQAYLQILYNAEAVKINRATAETSFSQMERAREMYRAGSISLSDYAQIESQHSSDKYNLVSAQSTLDRSVLELKQLLELEAGYDFQVEFPQIGDDQVYAVIPSSADVYNTALSVMPEVKSSRLSVEAAKMGENIAKAQALPSVSLSAGLGTGHATSSSDAFSRQLDNRFSQNVGLSISIPIFNNRQARSASEKARLETLSADISLQNTQKNLLSTIESLYQDAVSAQSRYAAALDKLKSAETRYSLVSAQVDAGMKNTVELLQEKNNYLSAQLQTAQSKYQAVLSAKLLDFYRDKPIEL